MKALGLSSSSLDWNEWLAHQAYENEQAVLTVTRRISRLILARCAGDDELHIPILYSSLSHLFQSRERSSDEPTALINQLPICHLKHIKTLTDSILFFCIH